ncbi:DUF4160 domain-containing protein [Amycolatopsis sp. NPDC101161]|uniref:DUF4160 domain-containing protein n=1 Tax=Amycolatopsis sp. NPDC101161 TaxID=3363940 RepID=UPI0037FA345E
MTKSALDGAAEQLRAKYIPLLINHDWEQHIGVNLNARVVKLEDGEYAMIVVSGIFSDTSEFATYPTGAPNTAWADYEAVLDDVEAQVPMLLSTAASKKRPKSEPYPPTLAGQLELHLDSTTIAPDGSVYLIKQRVATIRDLEINVYPKDHDPPHFHVRSKQRNLDARFHVYTLELINEKHGKVKPKEVRQIQDFFKNNTTMHTLLKSEHERLQ